MNEEVKLEAVVVGVGVGVENDFRSFEHGLWRRQRRPAIFTFGHGFVSPVESEQFHAVVSAQSLVT